MSCFDHVVNRRNTGCYKWDMSEDPDVLPMFVADMDFQVAPAITEAIHRRVDHAIYGYTKIRPAFYEAIQRWNERRHQWHIHRESIVATIGIVPAISAILRAMTEPGDGVVIQTPVYNCFFHSIEDNGRKIIENHLLYDSETHRWSIDFEDFEEKIASPETKLFILCNPHNPVGRIWTKAELQRLADICLRHQVPVISDEIHCELVMNGHVYTPFASLGDDIAQNAIVCLSPSKAFNIAGLQIAHVVVDKESWRAKIEQSFHLSGIWGVNAIGVEALIAAYNDSEEWLDALNLYIWQNYLMLKAFCAEKYPDFYLSDLEGTYLAWLDCSPLKMKAEHIGEVLNEKAKLYINHGGMYGSDGDHFIRINLACPRSLMEEGLKRLDCGLQILMNESK